MTNPTLERAARALIQAKYGDADDSYWEMLDGDAKTLARTMARAVLMAVREPDEKAIREGCVAFEDTEGLEQGDPRWIDGYDYLIPPTKEAFTAMIDAILAEGE